jgi:hypothetical protein
LGILGLLVLLGLTSIVSNLCKENTQNIKKYMELVKEIRIRFPKMGPNWVTLSFCFIYTKEVRKSVPVTGPVWPKGWVEV